MTAAHVEVSVEVRRREGIGGLEGLGVGGEMVDLGLLTLDGKGRWRGFKRLFGERSAILGRGSIHGFVVVERGLSRVLEREVVDGEAVDKPPCLYTVVNFLFFSFLRIF